MASSSRRACPSGLPRSRVNDCLLRECTFHHRDTPLAKGPQLRRGSPEPGRSTFTTSAPKSASRLLAVPPATIIDRSSTFMPWSGPERPSPILPGLDCSVVNLLSILEEGLNFAEHQVGMFHGQEVGTHAQGFCLCALNRVEKPADARILQGLRLRIAAQEQQVSARQALKVRVIPAGLPVSRRRWLPLLAGTSVRPGHPWRSLVPPSIKALKAPFVPVAKGGPLPVGLGHRLPAVPSQSLLPGALGALAQFARRGVGRSFAYPGLHQAGLPDAAGQSGKRLS